MEEQTVQVHLSANSFLLGDLFGDDHIGSALGGGVFVSGARWGIPGRRRRHASREHRNGLEEQLEGGLGAGLWGGRGVIRVF